MSEGCTILEDYMSYIYCICMIGKISTCTDVREDGEGCVYVINIYYSICLFLQYVVIIIAHFITY